MSKHPLHVIIPTLYAGDHTHVCFSTLRYLPRPNVVHLVNAEDSWPKAVNKGLRAAFADAKSGNFPNVVIMDDDIELLPGTFKGLEDAQAKADCIGFKLLTPGTDKIQHAGGVFTRNPSDPSDVDLTHRSGGAVDEPGYVPHVTTSLAWIRGDVFETVGGFETAWPGLQFEDADFMFRALNAGYRVYYTPEIAYHYESATKGPMFTDEFNPRIVANYRLLKQRWLRNPDFRSRFVNPNPHWIARLAGA